MATEAITEAVRKLKHRQPPAPPGVRQVTLCDSKSNPRQSRGLNTRISGVADAWVWPLTAAIVMGGSILFWSLAGLFWLAARPSQPPIVIRMAHPTAQANAGYPFEYDNEQRSGHVAAEAIR